MEVHWNRLTREAQSNLFSVDLLPCPPHPKPAPVSTTITYQRNPLRSGPGLTVLKMLTETCP